MCSNLNVLFELWIKNYWVPSESGRKGSVDTLIQIKPAKKQVLRFHLSSKCHLTGKQLTLVDDHLQLYAADVDEELDSSLALLTSGWEAVILSPSDFCLLSQMADPQGLSLDDTSIWRTET